MSQIFRVVIVSKSAEDGTPIRTTRCFPDDQHLYWDVSNSENGRSWWYYQMHLSTVLDLIYRAGLDGHKVYVEYKAGDKVVL